MITKEQRSKLGKASKRKGYYNESETGKEYMRLLGGLAKPTPRSGAYSLDFKGDLFFKNNICEGKVVDCKFGKTAVPKKIQKEMEKLMDEAQGACHWLDIKIPNGKAYCVIERKYLLSMLGELQDWRREFNEKMHLEKNEPRFKI